jgi:hypothetical protein
MDVAHIPKYKLGAGYCRKCKNGGVCIFAHEDLNFTALNVHKYSKERVTETTAI